MKIRYKVELSKKSYFYVVRGKNTQKTFNEEDFKGQNPSKHKKKKMVEK